jgi:hypothetical protein
VGQTVQQPIASQTPSYQNTPQSNLYTWFVLDGVNNSGTVGDYAQIYLNGNLVTEPVITVKEWNVIGMTFANSLSFNSYVGKITLNGTFIFNNIATYQASSLQEIQSKITRPWFNVKTNGIT